MWFVGYEGEDLFCRTHAQFYMQKRTDTIEHEEIGTYARIQISQDADNADQKSKIVLKVDETYRLFWKAYFQLSFF